MGIIIRESERYVPFMGFQGSQNLVKSTAFYKHQMKCLFCTDRQQFLKNCLSIKKKDNDNDCKLCSAELQ